MSEQRKISKYTKKDINEMKTVTKKCIVGWLSVCCMALTASAGTYREQVQTVSAEGNPITCDLIDIKIFIPPEADLDVWYNIVRKASRRIWNMTERQVAFGNVEVYRRSEPGETDVRFGFVRGRSRTAYVNNYSERSLESRSQKIWMVPESLLTETPRTPNTILDGNVLAHEFGHYVFGLRDEYYDVLVNPANPDQWLNNQGRWKNRKTFVSPNGKWGESQYGFTPIPYVKPYSGVPGCTEPKHSGRLATIMDGYSLEAADRDDQQPDTQKDTELCTPTRVLSGSDWPWPPNVLGWDTAHDGRRLVKVEVVSGRLQDVYVASIHDYHHSGESGWETALRVRPSLTAPQQQPFDSVHGWPELNWILAEIQPSVMICMDRSGSMGYYNIMQPAKDGAKKVIDNSKTRAWWAFIPLLPNDPGDNLGLVTYATSASINFQLAEMVNTTTQNSLKQAIDGIRATGMTAIGDGLRRSLNEFVRMNGDDPAGSHEAIFLLSDGEHNQGEDPEGQILSDLQDRGVRVHTIALGPAVDAGLMRRLAQETGGKTRRITDATELDEFFAEIYNFARDASPVDSVMGSIDTAVVEHQMVVDSFSDMDISFNLFWGSGTLDLNLMMPDGTLIDQAEADANPDIELIRAARSITVRVRKPATGVWTVRVLPLNVAGSEDYSVQMASVGRSNVRLEVSVQKDAFTHPEPLRIEATLTGPFSGITGAELAGKVLRPDGSEVDFTLYDSGDPAHGDESASDGRYANYFRAFSADGEYRFVMTAVNVDGVTVIGFDDLLIGADEGISVPVAPFSRQQTITVHYDGIPEFINVTPFTTADFATWELDRNTGAMVGSLEVRNLDDSVKTLIEPFWYAATETQNIRLAQIDGYTEDGDPYVDVTTKVNAALLEKYGRQSMMPGESVVIEGIRVFSRDRSIPDMSAIWALWADPPGDGERRIDNYDINADGILSDSEILLAVQNWYANDMPDFDLLRRVELWKSGPNPFRSE